VVEIKLSVNDFEPNKLKQLREKYPNGRIQRKGRKGI